MQVPMVIMITEGWTIYLWRLGNKQICRWLVGQAWRKKPLRSVRSRDPDCFPVGGGISAGVDGGDGGFCGMCVCVCAQLVCSCVVFGHTVDSLLEYLTTNLINSRVWVYLIVLTPPASKHPSNIRLYLRLTFSHFFVVVLFMPPCHLIALPCFFSVYFSPIVSSFLYKTVCFLFS